MSEQQAQQSQQRMRQARVAKMNPKVVMWVSLAAGMIALMSFSLLFIHAAFRNEWW